MNTKFSLSFVLLFLVNNILAQNNVPTDYLSADFHKSRREALRASMPENSVAVFFSNAIRNRANDVDFVYHQDPNFYYLTGLKEPHSVLVIFSEKQQQDGKSLMKPFMCMKGESDIKYIMEKELE